MPRGDSVINGGPGSGNFGHAGIPGQVGGSAGVEGGSKERFKQALEEFKEIIGGINKEEAKMGTTGALQKSAVPIWDTLYKKYRLDEEDSKKSNQAPSGFYAIKTNVSPLVRNETLDGRSYLVFPAILINEGVHNGSQGPLFYPAKALQSTVESWNHKPVLVYHPELNGKPCGSCNPKVLEAQKVGFLMNAEWVPEGNKLRSDVWLDVEKCKTVSQPVLDKIQLNQMIEVSTGLYTDDKPVENAEGEAVFNGKKYRKITTNHRPDHLALLPDRKGACSIADGAGAPRLNEENSEVEEEAEDGVKQVKEKTKGKKPAFNELSHDEVRCAIREAVQAKYPSNSPMGGMVPRPYVMEVYPDYCIFEVGGIEVGGKSTNLWKQGYILDQESDTVELDGEPEQVQRKVTYEPVTLNQEAEEKQNMADEKKVEIPAIVEKPAPTFNELLNAAPAEIRESIEQGTKMVKAKRAEFSATIKANSKNKFTDEQLNAMPFETLDTIAAMAVVPTFAGQGGEVKAPKANEAKIAPLPLPDYSPKK